VELFRNIAERVLQRELHLVIGELKVAPRCTTELRIEFRIFGEHSVELNGHASADFLIVHGAPSFLHKARTNDFTIATQYRESESKKRLISDERKLII
jgi:hypothetical protein